MQSVISLTSHQLAQLATIAKNALPNESCAFLLGQTNDDMSQVEEVLHMANAVLSPYSFSIASSDLLQAYRDAESRRMQVVGIFHSHPGRPTPSGTDLKYMELNPVVWLIYSTTEQRFDAHINDGGARPVELRIKD